MQTPSERPALAALIGGAVLIGFAPIFVRWVDVGYTAAAFWRAALALPVLLLFVLRENHPHATHRPATGSRRSHDAREGRVPGAFGGPGSLAPLWLAGLFFGADLAVWHQSIRFTSVANATLLANLAPAFVTLAAFLLFRERFRLGFLAGLGLALTGAAVLVSASVELDRAHVVGDLYGVLAAVFYAGYLLTVSRTRARFSAAQVMFWSSFATAALLLPIALVAGETLFPGSLRGWWVLIGLALLSHVAGQGLIAWALAHLPAAFSAVGLLVQPCAAALFGWLLLGEAFGARQALGGAVVLAGIVLCRAFSAPPARVAA